MNIHIIYDLTLPNIFNCANQICLLKQKWKGMKTQQVKEVYRLQPHYKSILSEVELIFSIWPQVHPVHPTPEKKKKNLATVSFSSLLSVSAMLPPFSQLPKLQLQSCLISLLSILPLTTKAQNQLGSSFHFSTIKPLITWKCSSNIPLPQRGGHGSENDSLDKGTPWRPHRYHVTWILWKASCPGRWYQRSRQRILCFPGKGPRSTYFTKGNT